MIKPHKFYLGNLTGVIQLLGVQFIVKFPGLND